MAQQHFKDAVAALSDMKKAHQQATPGFTTPHAHHAILWLTADLMGTTPLVTFGSLAADFATVLSSFRMANPACQVLDDSEWLAALDTLKDGNNLHYHSQANNGVPGRLLELLTEPQHDSNLEDAGFVRNAP